MYNDTILDIRFDNIEKTIVELTHEIAAIRKEQAKEYKYHPKRIDPSEVHWWAWNAFQKDAHNNRPTDRSVIVQYSNGEQVSGDAKNFYWGKISDHHCIIAWRQN